MGHGSGAWRRRRPEESALYRAVASAWATLRERLEAGERPLPRFCAREVDAFLRCGVLAHGFARLWCQACGKDDVVAFSCKGRGFCPSCGARRMADTAAWLVDRVIPEEASVRQWVLSLPYRVRVLCAYDPDACALVRRVLVRAVSGFYEVRARRQGLPRPRTGAVAFVQRFDSGLRLNLHYHVVWLDGVYSWQPGHGGVAWHGHEGLEDAHVALLVRRVRDRVLRASGGRKATRRTPMCSSSNGRTAIVRLSIMKHTSLPVLPTHGRRTRSGRRRPVARASRGVPVRLARQ